MATVAIRNSFSSRVSKLRLPRRFRSREKLETPQLEDIEPSRGGSGGADAACAKEEEFRKVFKYFDANDDGRISALELRDYFASVGDSVSNEEAERIIREFAKGFRGGGGVDEDSPALLEFGAFVRMMESREGDEEDDSVVLRRVFEVFEGDKGGGCITAEGLRCVLRRLGDVKSRQECEAMIRVFDLDGNGVLDFQEFRKMMS